LESIYEPVFKDSSHGFRMQRSCHTALKDIKYWTGTKWFIEFDIEGYFDNIDHNILMGLLEKKIDDTKFLNIIRKMVKAGYVEDWKYHNTYSGTPQGGILSPILANIYLAIRPISFQYCEFQAVDRETCATPAVAGCPAA